MYNQLLVPLDGSAFGERALPLALALARHLRARMVLLRAVSGEFVTDEDPAQARRAALDEAEQYLANLQAQTSDHGVASEIVVVHGPADECIVDAITARAADMVVMCTHGRSGLGRWIYGSVAEKVLAASPAPVLLVHPTGDAKKLELGPAGATLVVPLDGSAFAEAALPHAAELARLFDGRILLVRAVPPPTLAFADAALVPAPSPTQQMEEAASYLAAVAEGLRARGVEVETLVREGWPADVVAAWHDELRPALVIMATHGRTGVARFLLGSVALEVVRRSPLPVMLVRPAQHAQP